MSKDTELREEQAGADTENKELLLLDCSPPLTVAAIEEELERVYRETGYYETYLNQQKSIEAEREQVVEAARQKAEEAYYEYDELLTAAEPSKLKEYNAYMNYKQLKEEADQLDNDYAGQLKKNEDELFSRVSMETFDELSGEAGKTYDDKWKVHEFWKKQEQDTLRDKREFMGATEQEVKSYQALRADVLDFYAKSRAEMEAAEQLYVKMEAIMKAKEALDEAARVDDLTYVAEMAVIQCSCGLRKSYLFIPEPQHVYVKGSDVCTVNDVKPDENVFHFGGCISSSHPLMEAQAKKVIEELQEEEGYTPKESKKVDIDKLISMCACECTPEFLSNWRDGQDKVLINGSKPLLRRSELICKHGGTITFRTSGQPD